MTTIGLLMMFGYVLGWIIHNPERAKKVWNTFLKKD